VAEALNLSKQEIALLAINSFKASFLEETVKQNMIEKVQKFLKTVS
jgi:adenosine deaminase